MLIFLTATRPRKMALMPVPTAFNTTQLAASVLDATDSPSVIPLRAIIAVPTPAAATFMAAKPATAVRIAVRFSLAHASVLRSKLPTAVKGRECVVTVMPDGFDFEGDRYKTLSAVAKAITGQHWNGFRFFNLHKQESA